MSVQKYIEFLRNNGVNIPQINPSKYNTTQQTIKFWKKYEYMMKHVANYVKLFLENKMMNRIKIHVRTCKDEICQIEFSFHVGEFSSNCYCSSLEVIIGFTDTKTQICDGFSYYNSKKQYFGKQFINVIQQYYDIVRQNNTKSGIQKQVNFIKNNFCIG